MADHTAGVCATTMLRDAATSVLTSSMAFSLVAPGRGDRLLCRASVIKSGKTLIVVDSGIMMAHPTPPHPT